MKRVTFQWLYRTFYKFKYLSFSFFLKMSVFDTELFILEIEKEECLWKTNSKEYMVDRYAKAKAWVNIASRVFDEWDGFNKEEQELKSKLIKFCL